MDDKNINKRIAAIIEDRKSTPNAFASQLGFKATVIYNILKERNKPGYDLLLKISETFNVSGNWLLNGDGAMYNNDIDPASKYHFDIKIISDAEFINQVHEYIRKINYIYQRLIDIRVLLFQELKLKGQFSTQSEADLKNNLTNPVSKEVDGENILRYPYENLIKEGKTEYLKKLEGCLDLFTNTFFECFEQLYNGLRIPVNKELQEKFLADRSKMTDQFKYSHYIKSYK